MESSRQLQRLEGKSLDGQFLWELQDGFELSPRESSLILETVRLYYGQSPEARSGRVSLWVVSLNASVGKPLHELRKVQVWVTLDSGQEDLDAYERYGHAGLRRQKLLRITDEIVEQGGVPTQEDLARLLGTSVRTMKRDICYLRKQGLPVVTRGVYSGDLPPDTPFGKGREALRQYFWSCSSALRARRSRNRRDSALYGHQCSSSD